MLVFWWDELFPSGRELFTSRSPRNFVRRNRISSKLNNKLGWWNSACVWLRSISKRIDGELYRNFVLAIENSTKSLIRLRVGLDRARHGGQHVSHGEWRAVDGPNPRYGLIRRRMAKQSRGGWEWAGGGGPTTESSREKSDRRRVLGRLRKTTQRPKGTFGAKPWL